jgi:hypothetical protein
VILLLRRRIHAHGGRRARGNEKRRDRSVDSREISTSTTKTMHPYRQLLRFPDTNTNGIRRGGKMGVIRMATQTTPIPAPLTSYALKRVQPYLQLATRNVGRVPLQ